MFSLFRSKLGVTGILLLGVGLAFMIWRYMHEQGEAGKRLYVPIISRLYVGDVPIEEKQEKPGEAMVGHPAMIRCDSVPPRRDPRKPLFRLSGESVGLLENQSCEFAPALPGNIGAVHSLKLEYFLVSPSGQEDLMYTRSFAVMLVPAGSYLRIRNFADANGEQLSGYEAPHKVIPYVEAAVSLAGEPSDYRILLFVNRTGNDSWIVQTNTAPDDPGELRLNEAPLVRFRTWGNNLEGYAAWPGGYAPESGRLPDPIELGDPNDSRQAFDVAAVLMRTDKVDELRKRVIKTSPMADGTLNVNVIGISMEQLKEAAWNEWVSETASLVRAPVRPARTAD